MIQPNCGDTISNLKTIEQEQIWVEQIEKIMIMVKRRLIELRELENWRRSNLSLKINVSVSGVWSYFVDSVLRGSFHLEKWSNQIVVILLAIWKPTGVVVSKIKGYGWKVIMIVLLYKK